MQCYMFNLLSTNNKQRVQAYYKMCNSNFTNCVWKQKYEISLPITVTVKLGKQTKQTYWDLICESRDICWQQANRNHLSIQLMLQLLLLRSQLFHFADEVPHTIFFSRMFLFQFFHISDYISTHSTICQNTPRFSQIIIYVFQSRLYNHFKKTQQLHDAHNIIYNLHQNYNIIW